MAIKNAKYLNVSILDGKKVVLIHIVIIAFPAAIFHILKLLFGVPFEMVQNVLSVQDFFRIVEKDFVVPGFLRILEVIDPGRH